MKWSHDFEYETFQKTYRVYKCGDIRIRVDFFEHMLRVAVYKKGQRSVPTYSVCPGECKMPRHGRSRLSTEGLTPLPQEAEIRIDDVDIDIGFTKEFRIRYRKGDKELFSDRAILAYNFEGELGDGSYHYITREDGEHVYGLGDKTGSVNHVGKRLRMETFDTMGFDANASDPLYKQVPFFICKNSVGAYGIYYDTYSTGEFDLGAEHNNYYPKYKYAHFEEDALVYYVIFGSVSEILHRFLYLTGKAALMPKWAFRYCGSTMAYTDAPDTERQLRGFLENVRKNGLDCGGFYLSSGYTSIGNRRYVFTWNEDKIPDPKALAMGFAKEGINFLPNVKPVLLSDHPFWQELKNPNLFLHYTDGSVAFFPFWDASAAYFDFTNDETYELWMKLIRTRLIEKGYASIWNDNNEYDVHDKDVQANGFGHPLPARLIRPLFPFLMAMASREAGDQNQRIMNVSRSGIAGLERVASTWTGDNRTSFEDFRGNHKMAMSMALSGFRFFGQDIGGFAGPKPSPELFLRWIQYGLFTPRFTLHSWNQDGSSTMPWLYPELLPEVQALFQMRAKFIPYIFSEANRVIEEYRPLIYPVFLEYPEYDEESDCFFFGQSILACPVFDEGKEELEVNLPNNQEGWYLDNALCRGTMRVKAPLHGLPPYFVRAGSIVPMEEDGIVFHVYPIASGEFEFRYYDDETIANTFRKISVICKENEVVIRGVRSQEQVMLHDAAKRPLIVEG